MKVVTTATDKLVAYLALFSGLSISAVAEYYSIMGLMAIFSAAVIPIIVMGAALGVSKLVATVWVKTNWERAPFFIKSYLLAAILILMMITSMGIFGFLSKAHSDQGLISGDVMAKIAVYDDRIQTEKENIETNRKALKQMDEAVDQVMGRSTSENGADKAVYIRRTQQKERGRLIAEISDSQKKIAALAKERSPIAAEVRKVEAEVGPIKYIAALLYGDNPDSNTLERAVRWVIILIVIIFDPLAVAMLLASQYSFMWFRKNEEIVDEVVPVTAPIVPEPEPVEQEIVEMAVEPIISTADFYEELVVAPVLDEIIAVPAAESVEEADAIVSELAIVETVVETAPTEEVIAENVEEIALIEEVIAENVEEIAPIEEEQAVPVVTYNELSFDDVAKLERGESLFAPPGTPGEVWDIPADSEQQTFDNIDKIYKSKEEIAAAHRKRGWFQPVFPKNDNN